MKRPILNAPRLLATALCAAAAMAAPVSAQDAAATPEPRPKGPTEITASKEASFNQKTREAVFVGEVNVRDPQFTLRADKLTAILKDSRKPAGAPAPPKPADGSAQPANGFPAAGASGLERAIAEGKVVIVAERPGEKAGETTKYIARAAKAIFEEGSGNMTLIGWPQVTQGINTHIATEEGTVMVINRDGKMNTNGRSRTVIQDKPETPDTRP